MAASLVVHCPDCSGTERPCVVCGVETLTTAPAGDPVACCFGHYSDAMEDDIYFRAWFNQHPEREQRSDC